VQDPLALAETILDQPGWDRSGIDHVIERGRTRYVDLVDPLPVLLYYLTAFADEQGKVGFRQDIYGRDEALRAAFSGPVVRTRIGFPEPPAESTSPDPEQLKPAPDGEPPDPTVKDTSVRLTGRHSPEGRRDEGRSGADGADPAVSTLDRSESGPGGRL
jgi:hypothetical protein